MKHLFLVLTLGNCFSGAKGQKGKQSWALEEFRAKPAEKKLNHLHLMALINHRYEFYFSLLSSCPYSHPFPSCWVEHLHKSERKWKPSGDALNCLSTFPYINIYMCVCVCVCNVHVNFYLHSSLLLWLRLTPLSSSVLPSMCFSFTLAYQRVCIWIHNIYRVNMYFILQNKAQQTKIYLPQLYGHSKFCCTLFIYSVFSQAVFIRVNCMQRPWLGTEGLHQIK